jgi:hypothetical protein
MPMCSIELKLSSFIKQVSMNTRTLLIAMLLVLLKCGNGVAGDSLAIHLTGDPAIDLFSHAEIDRAGFDFSDVSFAGMTATSSLENRWREGGRPEASRSLESRRLFADEPSTSLETGAKRPIIAALISLVIPGAGEAYAGDYVRGTAVFAAQVFSIGAAINYSNKANQQTQLNENYANEHWSATRYVNWTLDNLKALNPNDTTTAAEYRQSIFVHGDTSSLTPPYTNINWTAMNNMEDDVGNGVYNGYTHWLFGYGTSQFYKEIGKYDQWSAGWDDGLKGALLPGQIPVSYESPHFVIYRNMRALADNLNVISSTWVGIALAEHFLSAADAFWVAKQHNNSLHADLHLNFAPVPGGVSTTAELAVQYALP